MLGQRVDVRALYPGGDALMAQAYVGTTPRGNEIYREIGGDRYFVRKAVEETRGLVRLNTVRDLHCRKELGRFQSFTEAAAFADARGVAS